MAGYLLFTVLNMQAQFRFASFLLGIVAYITIHSYFLNLGEIA